MSAGQYHIRPLTEADAGAFRALRLAGLTAHPDAFGESAAHFESLSPAEVSSRITGASAHGGFILGGFRREGTLSGIIALARGGAEKSAHRALIWGMFVEPESRGSGLAKQLLDDCLLRAASIPGVDQVHLAVVTTNEPAKKLYERAGFIVYGTDPNALKVDGQTFDEYLMVKNLCGGGSSAHS